MRGRIDTVEETSAHRSIQNIIQEEKKATKYITVLHLKHAVY